MKNAVLNKQTNAAIERFQPVGLNTSHRLLPELLLEAGYATHLVGKWHLGYCHPDYLPTNRGFQTAVGQWNHATGYYTRWAAATCTPRRTDYTETMFQLPEDMAGYDFHDGLNITYEGQGEFLTDFLTRKAVERIESHDKDDPLFLYVAYQAPHSPWQEPPARYVAQYGAHRDRNRLGLVSALDAGVGAMVDALKSAGLYGDTVVVLTTDNGGAAIHAGGNLPLRGGKEQL